MALQEFLNRDSLGLLRGLFRGSPRQARRTAAVVPIVACLPGSDVWFLRMAIAFAAHLQEGGCVADRLTQRVAGNAAGRPFNFDHLRGGPLLWAPGLVPGGHLFVGHAVCPGFNKIAGRFPWWQDTRFCAPGYDYFSDGLDYAQVPVDLAPHASARVSVSRLDTAAWTTPAQRAVLVYCDPVEQASGYFNFCRSHTSRVYNTLDGRRLVDWKFRDYLFKHALPSYAKLFISYQAMAAAAPQSVSLVPHGGLLERPAETLAAILSHLTGRSQDWPTAGDAVDLARHEHLVAVEKQRRRPLDRSRRRNGHSPAIPEGLLREQIDPALRCEAVEFLASLGVDRRFFAPAHDGTAAMAAMMAV